MILNGECGAFNPLLLECLLDIQGRLKEEMTTMSEERAETEDSEAPLQNLKATKRQKKSFLNLCQKIFEKNI